MTKSDEINSIAENLLKGIGFIAPLYYEECIDVGLFVLDKILETNPTLEYWKTYDDERNLAVTVWSEVKARLQEIKNQG